MDRITSAFKSVGLDSCCVWMKFPSFKSSGEAAGNYKELPVQVQPSSISTVKQKITSEDNPDENIVFAVPVNRVTRNAEMHEVDFY
ncbi:hypothetical protein CHUAL_002142 [Chamberlinius hualienensis]